MVILTSLAEVAELVDALDSGSSGHSLWGFKSPLPHQKKTRMGLIFFLWRWSHHHYGEDDVLWVEA